MACHEGGPRGTPASPANPLPDMARHGGVRGGSLPHPRMLSRKLPSRLAYVPTVVENEGGNRERTFDIYSRLLRDRIILIGRPIDDVVANLVVAQLMYLAADDPEKEIQIYINSPGGAVTAGLAIYDTMQYVRAPISTVCIGRAASFGTVVLMAGAKGKRFSLPSASIHMHQPLIGGKGLQGQASDLDIHAREIIRLRTVLDERQVRRQGVRSGENPARDHNRGGGGKVVATSRSQPHHARDRDHRQAGDRDRLRSIGQQHPEVRQVDLAAYRCHGRPGLSQPLSDPVWIQEQRRRDQGRAGYCPPRDDLPAPSEDQRRAKGQDELRFH